ncbi:MAG: PilN domain-containing protein [Betaproteobacteria bacterium]|nr:PilN domain-containing protein [Betaproteobacteria bacterium]
MSQQINLLNPIFRKPFDWLTAKPVAIATCLMLVMLGVASKGATLEADNRERLADQRAEALKTAQDRLTAISKSIAESKPSAQLANDLTNLQTLLKSREEIMKVLEGGAIGSSIGFAEFLRGFARQAPSGLWLTGFTIGAGGNEMEIRGRMLNPAALPEYIRRLKTEKVFQGRSFASLTILRPEEGKENKIAATPPAVNVKPNASAAATPALPPSFVDFVLMPSIAEPTKAAVAPSGGAPAAPTNLADAAGIVPNLANLAKSGNESNSPKAPEKKP